MCVASKDAAIKILGKIINVFCSRMTSVKALHSQIYDMQSRKAHQLKKIMDIGIIHCKCEVRKGFDEDHHVKSSQIWMF